MTSIFCLSILSNYIQNNVISVFSNLSDVLTMQRVEPNDDRAVNNEQSEETLWLTKDLFCVCVCLVHVEYVQVSNCMCVFCVFICKYTNVTVLQQHSSSKESDLKDVVQPCLI